MSEQQRFKQILKDVGFTVLFLCLVGGLVYAQADSNTYYAQNYVRTRVFNGFLSVSSILLFQNKTLLYSRP